MKLYCKEYNSVYVYRRIYLRIKRSSLLLEALVYYSSACYVLPPTTSACLQVLDYRLVNFCSFPHMRYYFKDSFFYGTIKLFMP